MNSRGCSFDLRSSGVIELLTEYSIHRAQLHTVDQTVLGEDVGRDDDLVSDGDPTSAAKKRECVFDRFIWIGSQRHQIRFDSAEQSKLTEHFGVGGEGENGRVRRTEQG